MEEKESDGKKGKESQKLVGFPIYLINTPEYYTPNKQGKESHTD